MALCAMKEFRSRMLRDKSSGPLCVSQACRRKEMEFMLKSVEVLMD